jgi:hypothetical protein
MRTFQALRVSVTALMIVCLLLAQPALAKKKKKEEEAPTKSYVLPYMVVIMMVSVGLMTVCRPGSRKGQDDPTMNKKETAD